MRKSRSILMAVLAGSLLFATTPLEAAPVAGGIALSGSTSTGNVIRVRSHGHYHGHGGSGAGIAAGIIGGAILGGIIASQPYYYGPGYYYGPPPGYYYGPAGGGDWYAYCSRRYRSFDPASGTYLGYDGLRHPCQ